MVTTHNIKSYNICMCTCSFDKCYMMATHIFPIQGTFIVITKIFSRSFSINTWFWCFWFFPSSWLFCGLIWSALFTKMSWRAIVNTVKPLLSGPLIKWTPSIKQTLSWPGPKINVLYFPL